MVLTHSNSKHRCDEDEAKYEKQATFDAVLPNVQTQKKKRIYYRESSQRKTDR